MLFIFDMGNVITGNVDVLPRISEKLLIPQAEISDFCGPDFLQLTTGKITTGMFWKQFSDHFQVRIQENYLYTCFKPENDLVMINLINEIRSSGHSVVCGTNTLDDHYRYHLSRGDYSVFDYVYASHMMGCAKPDPEFYLHILRCEKYRPEETVFIDDMDINVKSAEDIGIHSFLFEGYDKLIRDMKDEGLEDLRGIPVIEGRGL